MRGCNEDIQGVGDGCGFGDEIDEGAIGEFLLDDADEDSIANRIVDVEARGCSHLDGCFGNASGGFSILFDSWVGCHSPLVGLKAEIENASVVVECC